MSARRLRSPALPLWLMALVACGWCVVRSNCAPGDRLPKVASVNHYEPLDYHTGPLREKHDRITREVITEPAFKNIQFRFQAYERNFHIHLRPGQSVFTTGAVFKVNGKDSSSYDPATFYEGEVHGDESSHVTGHMINGVFSGVILTPADTFHIETAASHFPGHQNLSFHSFIYRERDVEFPRHPTGCGVDGATQRWMHDLQSSARPLHPPPPPPPLGAPSLSRYLRSSTLRKRASITSTGGNFCHMRVAVDHFFYGQVGSSDNTDTIAEVVTTFRLVQGIYSAVDFDGDGNADSITPSIQSLDILTQSDPGYRFGAPYISVTDFLDLWSQEDHTKFCLALLLTNRDFDNGVLGLAWVAQPPGGNRGGVCEGRVRLSIGARSLNTAIMTFTNYGVRQPRAVSVITMAHEIGHNFGSQHDPSTAGTCSPGGSRGNFIMFPQATNGQNPNNNHFSPCSIESMHNVLRSSKSSCFSNEAFCGNNIIEEGEECDGNVTGHIGCCDSMCMLLPGKACSSRQECCDAMCNIITTTNKTCREASDCTERSMCNGTSGACPPSKPLEAGIFCNNGSNVCDKAGNCVGSYCLQFLNEGLGDCQCSVDDELSEARLCDVCCAYQGSCKSTFQLQQQQQIPMLTGRTLQPGRSCNNFKGYCSQKDEVGKSRCIVVDNEKTLNDLIDLLSIDTLNTVVAWLTVYWWVAILIIFGILGLCILLQLTYRKRAPLKRKLSQARLTLRRQTQRGGGRRGGGGGGGGTGTGGRGREGERGSSDERAQLRVTHEQATKRLKAFFPAAEHTLMLEVIRHSSSESKAVKRLLELGYPMKKMPIPHA